MSGTDMPYTFDQDPLETDISDEVNYATLVGYGGTNNRTSDTRLEKKEEKSVSIVSSNNRKTIQNLKTRNYSTSNAPDTEITPLLHPSTSLPTVVGYERNGFNEDYQLGQTATTTRSEIGQRELSRKKRRRPRYNTLQASSRNKKPRPFIISPFMPISTQISVDRPRSSVLNQKAHYEAASEALSIKESSDGSGSESDEEESEVSDEEQAQPFLKRTIKTVSSLSSRQILTISMLSLANLCSTVAFSCIAPFYPSEAKLKNLSETQTGIVFGIFEFTMFVISPLFGKYIIKIGARTMFIAGIAVTGITAIFFGFLNYLPAGPYFFWFSLIVRVLEALGDAAFVTSSFAIAAKSFPKNVAFVVGILETFAGLGYTAGPVIGGLFYDIGGFQLPFLVLGVVLLVASVLAIFLIEKTKDEQGNSEDKGMLAIVKLPQIWIPIFSVIACAISLSFLDPTLSNHLESFKLSPTEIGLMFLLCGSFYTVMCPLFGAIMDKCHNGNTLLLLGSIATAFSMFFIGPTPILSAYVDKDLWVIGVSLAVLGLAASALYIPCFQMCLDEVKERGFKNNFHTYGCVSGIFQAAFGFGSFLGPTIGSVIVESVGFRWTTTFIAFLHLFLILVVVMSTLYKKCRK
uniref:MFS domain-containing protein n=1 Tax=Caenorhabditis tropicalis TaxID=1561998 RepID=A0A1I7T8U7_9PELO